MTAIDLARNIVFYAGTKHHQMTNLKLQKTLYYTQGYFSAEYDSPLFEEHIVNWAYGPVVPAVYYQYCSYGASVIVPEKIKSVLDELTEEQAKVVYKGIDACLQFSAGQLVEKTHLETPWKNTSRNQVIEFSDIKNFFESNDPLKLK